MKNRNLFLMVMAVQVLGASMSFAASAASQPADPCRATGIRKIMAVARKELADVQFVDGYYDDNDGGSGAVVDVEVKGTDSYGKSCEHFYSVDMTGTPGKQCTAGKPVSGGCDGVSETPWCAKGSFGCPTGWTCSDTRVPNDILGTGQAAPNDPEQLSWDGPDCGKGGNDDATCPRYCKKN